MSFSRRNFLSGRFRTGAKELRPPWALPEDAFEDACSRCGDCVKACPAAIVIQRAGGFPQVDFSKGECSFCGDCARSCVTGALQRQGERPWGVKAAIGHGCLAEQGVECRVCGEACGAGAIRFRLRRGGAALPELDSTCCSGCGACSAPCPANAITLNNGLENNG